MNDFTFVSRRDVTLSECLWDNGYHDLSDSVDFICGYEYDYPDIADAFTEAVSDILGVDLGYSGEEVEEDDFFDMVESSDFKSLVEKTANVLDLLSEFEEPNEVVELIEFLAGRDPYDPPYDDTAADGKIDFYVDIVDMIKDDPNELISQLEDMKSEDEENEEIDDYIEMLKGEI